MIAVAISLDTWGAQAIGTNGPCTLAHITNYERTTEELLLFVPAEPC